MKYRKKLNRRTDRKVYERTANRVHENVIKIAQRGGKRI